MDENHFNPTFFETKYRLFLVIIAILSAFFTFIIYFYAREFVLSLFLLSTSILSTIMLIFSFLEITGRLTAFVTIRITVLLGVLGIIYAVYYAGVAMMTLQSESYQFFIIIIYIYLLKDLISIVYTIYTRNNSLKKFTKAIIHFDSTNLMYLVLASFAIIYLASKFKYVFPNGESPNIILVTIYLITLAILYTYVELQKDNIKKSFEKNRTTKSRNRFKR